MSNQRRALVSPQSTISYTALLSRTSHIPTTGLLVKPLGDPNSKLIPLPRFALYQRAIAIPELLSERSDALSVALVWVSIAGLFHLEYQDIRPLGSPAVNDEIGYHKSLTVAVPIVGALLAQAQPLGGGSGSVVLNVNPIFGK